MSSLQHQQVSLPVWEPHVSFLVWLKGCEGRFGARCQPSEEPALTVRHDFVCQTSSSDFGILALKSITVNAFFTGHQTDLPLKKQKTKKPLSSRNLRISKAVSYSLWFLLWFIYIFIRYLLNMPALKKKSKAEAFTAVWVAALFKADLHFHIVSCCNEL